MNLRRPLMIPTVPRSVEARAAHARIRNVRSPRAPSVVVVVVLVPIARKASDQAPLAQPRPLVEVVEVGSTRNLANDKPGGMSARVRRSCLPVLFQLSEDATRVIFANAMHVYVHLSISILPPIGRSPHFLMMIGFLFMMQIHIAELITLSLKTNLFPFQTYQRKPKLPLLSRS